MQDLRAVRWDSEEDPAEPTMGIAGYLANECAEDIVDIFNGESLVLKVSYAEMKPYIDSLPDDAQKLISESRDIRDVVWHAMHELVKVNRWATSHGLNIKHEDLIVSHASIKTTPLHDEVSVILIDEPPVTDLGADLSRRIGDYVSVEGIVRHISDPAGRVTTYSFYCACGNEVRVKPVGRFAAPKANSIEQCSVCEKSGKWSVHLGDSRTESYQQLKVQEAPESSRATNPREISIDLLGNDLIDVCSPGDRVKVSGRIRGELSAKSNLVEVWLEAESVITQDGSFEEVKPTDEQVELIETIAAREDLIDVLTRSISPSIYGNEMPKLGIIATLVGGQTWWTVDGERQRGESHLMCIGDPSTGKSELIKFAHDIAPRAMFANGKNSSAAGLTAATVQRDIGGTSEWTLEAGALVLADQGVAVIDELDKADEEDVSALHEAMQHGQVHISKAGINADLRTRTTVVAAANPKYGRWDQSQPLADQFDLDPSLISRFDLVFAFSDYTDNDRDAKIARSQLRARKNGSTEAPVFDPDNPTMPEPDADILPKDFLRLYIAHARSLTPEMDDDAMDLLEDFYVELRNSQTHQSIPVTARKVSAMARLAESIARLYLSETVTVEHASRAIDLIVHSLRDVGIDPDTGMLDAAIIESGVSTSQHERFELVEEILRVLTDDGREAVSRDAVVAYAREELEIEEKNTAHVLSKLAEQGEIFEPSEGQVALA
ncbi:ATP-binding protein [Haloplanus halophilus]|uniref:ATP-binding protein n=1 Tax=Haloplanus halophilus TaxID=2949993 RepID=UPI00203CDC5C|nr:minichromosome maintenance protein MCM [Haloplanus sp. GDY1]